MQETWSLNHKLETLFGGDMFGKLAAFRLNKNKTRAVSDPPYRKSMNRKL